MTRTRPSTWFASLRRDRGLFALVGCLVMLLNVLQPVVAQAEDGRWTICTIYGAEKPVGGDDLPSVWPDECPICIAGNHCASAPPAAKALLAFEPAFPAPASLPAPLVRRESAVMATPGLGAPPPDIRGPPVSA